MFTDVKGMLTFRHQREKVSGCSWMLKDVNVPSTRERERERRHVELKKHLKGCLFDQCRVRCEWHRQATDPPTNSGDGDGVDAAAAAATATNDDDEDCQFVQRHARVTY